MKTPPTRRHYGTAEPELPGLIPPQSSPAIFTPEQLARRDARRKKLVAVFAAARLERGGR